MKVGLKEVDQIKLTSEEEREREEGVGDGRGLSKGKGFASMVLRVLGNASGGQMV